MRKGVFPSHSEARPQEKIQAHSLIQSGTMRGKERRSRQRRQNHHLAHTEIKDGGTQLVQNWNLKLPKRGEGSGFELGRRQWYKLRLCWLGLELSVVSAFSHE
jgi:hypothetical protein